MVMIKTALITMLSVIVLVLPAAAQQYRQPSNNIPPPTAEQLAAFQSRAQVVLQHHLDDYKFMDTNSGAPRPGCTLDKRVADPNIPGLKHAGWICPKVH
jgi:hypothetical protein